MESTIVEKLKDKGLSNSSINLYIKALKNLNDKKEIKNLRFLTKPDTVLDKLKEYKPTTQRNVIIAIVRAATARRPWRSTGGRTSRRIPGRGPRPFPRIWNSARPRRPDASRRRACPSCLPRWCRTRRHGRGVPCACR